MHLSILGVSAIPLFLAAALAPGGSRSDVAIGWAMRGDTTRAERFFQDRYVNDSSDAAALNNLGNLAMLKGRPRSALALYERACTADSSDAGILLNSGVACAVLRDPAGALDRFARAERMAKGEHAALELLNIDARWDSDSSGVRSARPSARFFKALSMGQSVDARSIRRMLGEARNGATRDTVSAVRASAATDPPISELPLYWKR